MAMQVGSSGKFLEGSGTHTGSCSLIKMMLLEVGVKDMEDRRGVLETQKSGC